MCRGFVVPLTRVTRKAAANLSPSFVPTESVLDRRRLLLRAEQLFCSKSVCLCFFFPWELTGVCFTSFPGKDSFPLTQRGLFSLLKTTALEWRRLCVLSWEQSGSFRDKASPPLGPAVT